MVFGGFDTTPVIIAHSVISLYGDLDNCSGFVFSTIFYELEPNA